MKILKGQCMQFWLGLVGATLKDVRKNTSTHNDTLLENATKELEQAREIFCQAGQ
jgi:hypothetical protein